MSRDLEIIEQAMRANAQFAAIRAQCPPTESETSYQEFDTVALWLHGDANRKVGALRILLSRFGSSATRMLIIVANPSSHAEWHLQIKPRSDVDRPDGGKRRRRQDAEMEINRIGLAYYGHREHGLSDEAAIAKLSADLRLNLTPRTIKGRLRAFRRGAEKRGYVDPYATFSMTSLVTRNIPEPKWTVDQIRKPGRPKKIVQTAKSVSGGFPSFLKR